MYSELWVKPNTQKFIATMYVAKSVASEDTETTYDVPLGIPATALTYASWSKCSYIRGGVQGQAGTADTAVTLAALTAVGTWVSGGFLKIDDTNAPGLYQFGVPNAAIASGAAYVDFVFAASAEANFCSNHLRIHLARSLAH